MHCSSAATVFSVNFELSKVKGKGGVNRPFTRTRKPVSCSLYCTIRLRFELKYPLSLLAESKDSAF